MARTYMLNQRKPLPKVPNLMQDRKDYTKVMADSPAGNIAGTRQQRMSSRYNEQGEVLTRKKRNDPYI